MEKVPPDNAQCAIWGGYHTGPFRRVYLGCTGYTQQDVSFTSNRCKISDYEQTNTDLHASYLGAYTVDGHGGIDAGLVYTRKNASDSGKWQDEVLIGNNVNYGQTYACGQGTYSSTLTLVASPTQQTNEWLFQTNFGTVLIYDVPSTSFLLDGSNFVFRRLTAIAQPTQELTNGEWFGFPDNGSDGPDLSKPDIAYSNTYAGVGGSLYQFLGNPVDNAYANRNPKNFDNVTGAICGQDPLWSSPDNFDDYEGINLSNPQASGTFPAPNCY